jgi:hypothetical protein
MFERSKQDLTTIKWSTEAPKSIEGEKFQTVSLAIKKPLYKLIKFNLEEIQIQVITVIQIFKSKKPLQIISIA